MKCLQPRRITKNLDPVKFPMGLLVPCGQCMNCRLQKREEWVMRVLHESESWDSCLFLTLTYSNDHLPKDETLIKSDLQKFFKRLRKRLGKRKIKYFACGEYGEENGRPHYHCIIFGLDLLSKDDIELVKESWPLCDWGSLGRSPFGDVSIQSIRYVVSYVEKEILGKEAEYAYQGVLAPFRLLSKGMGRVFAEKHKEEFKAKGTFKVHGRERNIPRYYSDVNKIKRDEIQRNAKEREIELVKSITGLDIDRDEAYMTLKKDEIVNIEDAIKKSAIQHDRNLKKKIEISSRRKSRDV